MNAWVNRLVAANYRWHWGHTQALLICFTTYPIEYSIAYSGRPLELCSLNKIASIWIGLVAFPSVESLGICALRHCDSQPFHSKPIGNFYRPCSLCVCECIKSVGVGCEEGRWWWWWWCLLMLVVLAIEQIKIIVTIDETIDQSSPSLWICEFDQFSQYDIDCFDWIHTQKMFDWTNYYIYLTYSL